MLTRLCRLVFPHAFAEEAVLFPAARKVLDPGEEVSREIEQEHQEINEVYAAVERSLGLAWELVRRTSPTRAHPVVSRRPPGQTLSALPLTVLDRGRDQLDRLARRAPEPVAGGSRAASQALGAVVGLVERLPPFPRGEHPSTHTPRTRVQS